MLVFTEKWRADIGQWKMVLNLNLTKQSQEVISSQKQQSLFILKFSLMKFSRLQCLSETFRFTARSEVGFW